MTAGPPLILAFVLGRLFEEATRQALVMSRGGFAIFFSHPVSVVAWAGTAPLLVLPLLPAVRGVAAVSRSQDE